MRSEIRADSRLFRALSRTLLAHGYSVRFRASGRSMFPAIADGETVEVVPDASPIPGDVILFATDDSLLAHRVVRASPTAIVTRGDACFETDRPAVVTTVLGRIASVITPSGPRAPHTWRTRLRRLSGRLHFLSGIRVKL